jgi:SAM-dependent methyltransferase
MLKSLYYIKYFCYIALNWNLRLAFFSIYHEIKGEKKYNINTTRLNDLQKLSVKGSNRQYAEIYQGASYYLLENIFSELQKLKAPDGFIDIGSGKGRVLVVAAHYGFKKISGIDFARDLCREAEKNCCEITKKFPSAVWKVIHANAANFKFENDTNIFFFFNPFKQQVMRQVIINILHSQNKYPRKIFIVYINPQHKHLFDDENFKEIYYIKRMRYVDASVYEKDP